MMHNKQYLIINNPDSTFKEKVRAARILLKSAQQYYSNREEDTEYFKCRNCNRYVFFAPVPDETNGPAIIKGHIYSMLGADEFKITRLCEFCFDYLMKEPEDAEEA